LHHQTKAPAEWLAELDASRGGSERAVWALHYSGDRSEPVVAGLERWLRESDDLATLRAIDTVLVAWGVDFEPLTAARFVGGESFVASSDVLRMPSRLEGMSVDELVRELDSKDPLRIASASAALVLRRAEVQRALVALVDVPTDNPGWDRDEDGMGLSWDQWQEVNGPHLAYAPGIRLWILRFVRSAYVAALASELDRAATGERRMAMLRAIETARGDIGPAMRSLEPLIEGTGDEARLANALWYRAVGMH